MTFFIIKILVSATIIAVVTEIAKRYTLLGGLIAAMPITTLLSMIWLYIEKKDITLLSNFMVSVLCGTFISVVFFISALFLFKKGVNFYLTLLISTIILGVCVYFYQRIIQ